MESEYTRGDHIDPVAEEEKRQWANPTADDEDVQETEPTYEIVKQLIMEVKRFKSFTLLLHLYAIKTFLELCEKYHRSPRIKNPVIRASHTVAVSIGKGPYLARKI
jgi:hypothetical protein